jgi:hypothetical protein
VTTVLLYALLLTLLLPALLSGATPRSPSRVVLAVVVYLVAMAAPIGTHVNVALLAGGLLVIVVVNVMVILRGRTAFFARSITLVLNLMACILLFGNPDLFGDFNDSTHRFIAWLGENNGVIASLGSSELYAGLVALVGAYLATIEINHPIALILKQSHLMPAAATAQESGPRGTPLQTGEPARGRAIGYLERLIVFALTLSGNLSALGLVLVAKGIVRFQQLDDRDFAEYVLIGTLLSISAALLIGFAAKSLLSPL